MGYSDCVIISCFHFLDAHTVRLHRVSVSAFALSLFTLRARSQALRNAAGTHKDARSVCADVWRSSAGTPPFLFFFYSSCLIQWVRQRVSVSEKGKETVKIHYVIPQLLRH